MVKIIAAPLSNVFNLLKNTKRMDYFLILNKPIKCSVCAASKHPHTTLRVLWGWPLTFSCSIRGKDGRGRGKWRSPFLPPCSVRKWHGLTRNESHLWHLVPEVSSTCTSTPPPPPKQAASEEKPSNKRAHASSSSWKQRLHWACLVFSPSWRLVLSKRLVQTFTKCQRSHQEEASRLWFLDHLLCLKWLIRTDYRNAFSLPRWNFTLLSFMHFTGYSWNIPF